MDQNEAAALRQEIHELRTRYEDSTHKFSGDVGFQQGRSEQFDRRLTRLEDLVDKLLLAWYDPTPKKSDHAARKSADLNAPN